MKKILALILVAVILAACNQMLYDGTKKREPNPKVGRG